MSSRAAERAKFGVVVLTMGNRPDDLRRGLRVCWTSVMSISMSWWSATAGSRSGLPRRGQGPRTAREPRAFRPAATPA